MATTLRSQIERMQTAFGEDASTAPLLQCLLDQGEEWSPEMRHITHETERGHWSISVEDETPTTVTDRVCQHLPAVDPMMKQCYYNALALWQRIEAATYVEGYAVPGNGLATETRHAWLVIDGYLVDPTFSGDRYYGIRIDDATAERCYRVGVEHEVWGVLTNWKDDQQYLADHGY